jgi:colanic acid/amylovoran biosynthesis glycosyltransferase
MKTIYLFTDRFPYGTGEKTFVIPEIEALAVQYQVIIVPRINLGDDNESTLPKNVSVLRYQKPSKVRLLIRSLCFPFSSLARDELKDLLRDGFICGRLSDSVKTFANACDLHAFLKRNHAFDEPSEKLYFSFWFNAPCLAVQIEKMRRPGVRVISRIHGYDLFNSENRNGRQPFKRVMRDHLDRLVFVSENARKYFEDTFGKERFPGQYRPNRLGVKAHFDELEQPSAARSEKRLLVSCSNVIPGKRVHLIAEGLAECKRKDEIHWIHFGDGPELQSIKDLANEKGLDAEFRGYTKNEDIMAFYESNVVDAVILTTAHEGGCPVALQEALSFGIPIIGTDTGGVPETISDNGVLLKCNPTASEIADAIEAVCFADKEEVIRLRKCSLDLWEQRYNVKENKDAFLKIISEVINGA